MSRLVRKYRFYLLAIIIFILLVSFLHALPSDLSNHPELVWQVIETDHFRIFYYEGIERLALRAAKVAEEVYPPITSALEVTIPDKTPIVIVDYNRIANGLASPLGNSIIAWTTNEVEPTSISTTGEIPHLRTLIGHEFAHIATFHKVSGSQIPTWRLNALARIPTWFLEGIARDLGESWDPHRDMLLRMAALENTLLSAERMNAGFTGLDTLASSLIYEQGFSLVRYIKKEYGARSIARILDAYRRDSGLSFERVIAGVLKIGFGELYEGWRREITVSYGHQAHDKDDLEKVAAKITSISGFAFSPRFSPEGDRIAFTSSQDNDFARLSLYMMDTDGSGLSLLDVGVGPIISWSPDGNEIVYSRVGNHQGSLVSDLYVIGSDGVRRRITFGERAVHPDFSPDGSKIAFVREELGNKDIYIINADGSNLKRLTGSEEFDQSYAPRWSRDGRKIAYSSFRLLGQEEGKRDIFILDADGSGAVKMTSGLGDKRMATWGPDGELLFYTSDEDGIPNLYAALPLGEGPSLKLTDVVGAAWEPDISPDGKKIVLSGYSSQGFNIYIFEVDAEKIKDELKRKLALADQVDEHLTSFSFSAPEAQVRDESYNSFTDIKPLLLLPVVFGTLSSASSEISGAYFLFLAGLLQDTLSKHTLTFNTRFSGQSLTPRQGDWQFDFQGDYTIALIDPTISLDASYLFFDLSGVRTKTLNGVDVDIKNEQQQTVQAGITLSHGGLHTNYSLERTFEKLDLLSGGIKVSDFTLSLLGGGWRSYSVKPRVDAVANPVGGQSSISVEISHRAIGSDWGFIGGEAGHLEFIELPFYRNTLQLGISAGLREPIPGGAGRAEKEGEVRPFALSGDDFFSLLIIVDIIDDFEVKPQSVVLRGLAEPRVGSRYALANAEYRYPIFDKINLPFFNTFFLDSLFGDFFVDVGSTWLGDLTRREFYLLDDDGAKIKTQAQGIEDMVKVGIGTGLRLQVAVAGKSTAVIRFQVASEPVAGAELRPFLGLEASF